MFEVRNIAFSYGRRQVLRDVSFVVSPGETVVVVGGNGAGKTTLLKILATLAVPDSGMLLLDGKDALARSLEYRRQLGYLPENAALYGEMKVRDYLEYRANLKGELPKRIRRRIGEATELCQVTDLMRTKICRLSLGQRKRVALADALLLRPRVLLLDDFLAGLDRSLRAAAGSILSEVAAFSSVIVTGHEIEDLAKWATRFLLLRDGVIAATLPTAGVDPAALVSSLGAQLAKGGR